MSSAGLEAGAGAPSYLTCERGWRSWFFTLDHKRIALLYMASVLAVTFLGGVLAMLIRTELLAPKGAAYFQTGNIMGPDAYNKVFTLHGTIMVFLFVIPATPAILGNFALPVMLGAKDVAFPRLNLLSYYLYALGGLFFVLTMFFGSLDTGWTFYTPYSTTTATNVILATLGAFIVGFSSILTGINFIVTIHQLRASWMSWFRMPLFVWSLYATSVIQVLATPVLGITLLLLIAERTLGIGIFDPQLGGDPLLFQHFFWFYSHPAVYIMILPAMGIVSELIPVFSRKKIFGYKFIAFSSVAIALIGFLVWGHHMFVSGMSAVAAAIFSALTFAVAIPSAIKVFNWITTLYKGSISLATPMCYALSFIFLFGIGGLTGLFLGTLAMDVHLTDTYFVVAHFHYVIFGGTLMGFMGGLFYWWPKIFGRMYHEGLGRLACLLIFIGFNATFFPQFILGTKGMPRRYFDYDRIAYLRPYHVLSSIGAYLTMLGFLLAAGVLLHALWRGRRAPANPWGSATLEWQTSSPPPKHNFGTPPVERDPYDYRDFTYDEENDEWTTVKGSG